MKRGKVKQPVQKKPAPAPTPPVEEPKKRTSRRNTGK